MPEQPSQQQDMISALTQGLHPTTTTLELSNSDIINDFIHNLRGEIFNSSKESYEKVGEALMNEDGISYVVSLIASATSRDKTLADLDEGYVRNMTKAMVMDFIDMMEMEWESWGTRKTALKIIVRIVEHTIYAGMTRALNGNTMNQIARMNRDVNMQRMGQVQDEQGKWYSKLNVFNK